MRRKLMLSHIAVLLVFAVFTYTFVLRTVYTMICDNLVTVSDQVISSRRKELKSILDFGPTYILQFCINEQIQNVLREHLDDSRNTKELEELSRKAMAAMEQDNFLRNYMYANSVTLGNIPFMMEITYRADNGCYFPVYYSNRQNQSLSGFYEADDPWIQSLESRNGKFLWDHYSDSSNTYLRLSKVIYDTQDYSRILGTIALDFSYDHLSLNILNPLHNDYGISAAIVDSSTGTSIGYHSVSLPEDLSDLTSDCTLLLPDDSGCFFSRNLGGTTFCLVGTKSFLEVQKNYHKSCMALLGAAAAALTLGSVMAGILGYRISHPITQLSSTMKKVQNGNLDITVSTTSHGEIRELYDSFNYMIRMINQLIQENYVTLLNQKQSELNALQSQINTHFLYNTLDSINWLAKDYQADDISYLITNLSNLLRTSLNNGNPELSLEQELSHVHSYINIQQVRFAGLFRIEEDLDPSLNHDKVIKMLLQPLAENAILHSFNLPDSDPESNILTIRTKNLGEYMLLEICNNADPEALDAIYEILEEETREMPKNYGITSIRQRLEVAYSGHAFYTYSLDASGILHASIRIPRSYTMPDRPRHPVIS